jgi:predicted nucleic acid-binding protein
MWSQRWTSFVGSGPMLIVDASCLYEVVADTARADDVRARLALDSEHAAPSVVDAEVVSVIRRDHVRGLLDATAADQAVEDLREWPGERFGHRPLLGRVWELKGSLRTWDAFYVALAEALQATLITADARLARAPGPRCAIEVV